MATKTIPMDLTLAADKLAAKVAKARVGKIRPTYPPRLRKQIAEFAKRSKTEAGWPLTRVADAINLDYKSLLRYVADYHAPKPRGRAAAAAEPVTAPSKPESRPMATKKAAPIQAVRTERTSSGLAVTIVKVENATADEVVSILERLGV